MIGEGHIVGVREKDVFGIDFAGRRRSGADRLRSPTIATRASRPHSIMRGRSRRQTES
ncbi:hypothetical protein THIOKS1290008 [Thiocapsa sp. KS1]|nr:hypothetical protein THIOKS1290008 [Thiocapsa sp. KS1]